MRSIASLFGKSPFAPLQTHMDNVGKCVTKLSEVFACISGSEKKAIEPLVEELKKLEKQADIIRNDIRNHLPKNIFMPIDRTHFLEILSSQDAIAGKAEDIGDHLTLYSVHPFNSELAQLFQKSSSVFWDCWQIVKEINKLLESSFGGIEAEKVKSMVEKVTEGQEQTSNLQHSLMKKVYSDKSHTDYKSFHLVLKLMEEIGLIASLSKHLANRVRMVLELK